MAPVVETAEAKVVAKVVEMVARVDSPAAMETVVIRRSAFSMVRLLALLLILGFVTPATALSMPRFRAEVELGSSDNLFHDSSAVSDQFHQLNLMVAQNLPAGLTFQASGRLSRFNQEQDLSSTSHGLQLRFRRSLGSIESIWLNGGLSAQNYGEAYASYDRDRLFVSTGLVQRLNESFRLRANLQMTRSAYPGYPDSLAVDYREEQAVAGMNLALQWPLAIDLEAGLLARRYVEFDDPAATVYSWQRLRLSRPLGTRFSLVMNLQQRQQREAGTDVLARLLAHGMDPGDMLWDGWQLNLRFNAILFGWRGGLEFSRTLAHYADTTELTGFPARSDRREELGLTLSRGLPSKWLPVRSELQFYANLMDALSTDAFYTYHAFSSGLSLSFLLP
jgi:hypothetical protein